MPSRQSRPLDAGVTLVELVVTIGLVGVLMAIAVGGYTSWARSSEHEGAATEVQAVLRQAQQRAVTEGRATCVEFDTAGDRWTLFRGTCADPARTVIEGPVEVDSARVHLRSATFSAAGGATTGATFSSRGTATPGQVVLGRDGSSRTWTISVEGLTGRVETR
ncbi:GspH/FimT family pseudopilin [Nocardioides sp.]|uniref:GspH/FimT family pseudopilin n=1 Tax=Nocardioides sp. TaxID=35761 RepID=UPI00286CEBD0|nr:GspH/FimT family pseudopilin [Nocardioides sp.]